MSATQWNGMRHTNSQLKEDRYFKETKQSTQSDLEIIQVWNYWTESWNIYDQYVKWSCVRYEWFVRTDKKFQQRDKIYKTESNVNATNNDTFFKKDYIKNKEWTNQ